MMNDDTDHNPSHRVFSRRKAIASGVGALTAGVAGCMGGASDSTAPQRTGEERGPVAVASFFSFYDFARTIADGTPIEVRNLVPAGIHGHGWEPNASITKDIIEADAFVHVGPGFQPWADDMVSSLQSDDAAVTVVSAGSSVSLADSTHSHGDEHGHEGEHGHDGESHESQPRSTPASGSTYS